jgi:hypothetical protein
MSLFPLWAFMAYFRMNFTFTLTFYSSLKTYYTAKCLMINLKPEARYILI